MGWNVSNKDYEDIYSWIEYLSERQTFSSLNRALEKNIQMNCLYFRIIKQPLTFFTEASSPSQRAVTLGTVTGFLHTAPIVLTHTFHARDLCFTPESCIFL